MCYPKPGPRCSAHAAAAYAKAHQKVLHAFMNNKKDPELDRLIKLRNKAQQEYRITPAGIEEYARQVAENNPPKQWDIDKLAELKKMRADRIALVKDDRTVNHRKQPEQTYISTQLSNQGDELIPMSFDHPDLLASLKDSERWSHTLSDKEIATVAWYSQAGYADINGHLSVENFNPRYKTYPDGKLQEAVDVMDSAFEKYVPSPHGVVVHRRHHFYTDDGHHTTLTVEEIQKQFPAGSTYEPGFYLSTSLDPDNISVASSGVAALQILTRTGVPVTSISSQGPSEFEFITPRNAKFKVVANDIKMKTKNRQGETVEINVIQLEEI